MTGSKLNTDLARAVEKAKKNTTAVGYDIGHREDYTAMLSDGLPSEAQMEEEDRLHRLLIDADEETKDRIKQAYLSSKDSTNRAMAAVEIALLEKRERIIQEVLDSHKGTTNDDNSKSSSAFEEIKEGLEQALAHARGEDNGTVVRVIEVDKKDV